MVYTKVVTNKSPWLREAQLGGVYVTPASHGEGRFVASDAWIKKLFENGQVATQYCDPDGNVSMDEEWNVNGSYNAIEGITSPDGRVSAPANDRNGFGRLSEFRSEPDKEKGMQSEAAALLFLSGAL